MRVARGRAVGDHRDRLARSVRRVHRDLDVEHRGQAAQPLRADAQRIDLVAQLDAQFFGLVLRTAGLQLVHVDRIHQDLLRHQHGLLGGAADAYAQHAGRAPAGAHRRNGLHDPVDQAVARVEHHELALVLAAAALGRDLHVHRVARHHRHVDDRRRVVLGVLALELRVGHDAGAQGVVGVQIAAAHALVDRVLEAAVEALEAHVHADLQEDVDDAGVLADRPPALGTHLRIGQDLRDRVLGRRALLAGVGAGEVGDVVGRVVVADVLQRGGDGFDEVFLADGGHGWKLAHRRNELEEVRPLAGGRALGCQ